MALVMPKKLLLYFLMWTFGNQSVGNVYIYFGSSFKLLWAKAICYNVHEDISEFMPLHEVPYGFDPKSWH